MNLLSRVQKIALISLALIGIFASPSLASGDLNVDCNNAQTTLEMRVCANNFYGEADKKLNQVYQQLKPKFGSSQQNKLVTAQRAWIQFRDESCALEGAFAEGGTLEPVLELSCLAGVTEKRVKDLERYLEIVNNQ
ncbi:MAG: lysozyme inhibitor LprI family protein [Cyanobacteria bacterium J06635_10]